MRNLVRILVGFLVALIMTFSQPAQAGKISNCGKLPNVAVEDLRNIKAGGVSARPYNNAGGKGGTKLPSIGKGQEYLEYDIDANNPNPGNRGSYRVVALVTTEKNGKFVFDPIYFTQNHYTTFCEVRY